MKSDRRSSDELRDLLGSIEDGTISADGIDRLDELVRGDTELLHQYVEYMRLVSDLKFGLTNDRASDVLENLFDASGEQGRREGQPRETSRHEDVESVSPPASMPLPSIIIHPDLEMQVSPFSLNSPLGGMVFSYAASALFVCLGMLIGWTWKISDSQQYAGADKSASEIRTAKESQWPKPQIAFVGRITGMVECMFSDDQYILPPPSSRAFVPVGRKYKLDSGLMEITYTTGAKVILQGPVTYEAESASSGFLSIGKLTARVEKKGEVRGERGEISANPHSSTNIQHLPSPLFCVRTPTAVITDLGTEFGVECDKSGVTRSHVFLGSVRVQLHASDGEAAGPGMVLGENESAVVEAEPNRPIQVFRKKTSEKGPSIAYARRMPHRTPIKLFNTGVGIQEGQADPHWEYIARSDEPGFKPRPAVVSSTFAGCWLDNDPLRSQWISESQGAPDLPHGVTFTFRTTFELSGLLTRSAVLRGRFIADNQVKSIRLNGKEVPLPKFDDDNPFDQFTHFIEFSANQGFVEGTNSLEIDVHNGKKSSPPISISPVGLRVELEGYYLAQNLLSEAAKEDHAGRR